VGESRVRRLPAALGRRGHGVVKILCPPPLRRSGWFPSALPVATPLLRNVTAAKDPLNPNRLRVTPLVPRAATFRERPYNNSK